MTQPTIWRDDLPRESLERLWVGGPPLNEPVEGGEYFTVDALARGMTQFNDAMLSVCRNRGIECIDLANELQKDSSYFWDDVHYTDRGSRRVADIVAGHLLDAPPFLR